MKQYIVDTFTDKLFSGNPAAVCIMEYWPEEELMQNIAKENNLSETAFAVKEGKGYKLRWLTPGGEIDLCGHATLATAYVLMNFVDTTMDKIYFHTLSGELAVSRKDKIYEMEFPCYHMRQKINVTEEIEQAVGCRPLEAWLGRDLTCVLKSEAQVFSAMPDMEKVKSLNGLLLHLTAAGKEYACVSRSFAPKLNVVEDPVCGSGHCHIIPY